MSLSKYEKIRSAREREFQRTLIEAIRAKDASAPPSAIIKRVVVQTFKVLNSGAFLAALGILVSFGVFYHQTYIACVENSRTLYRDYTAVRMEVLQRQAYFAATAFNAKSIKDLQKTLSQIKFYDRQFREDTTVDLLARQAIQANSIDTRSVAPDPTRSILEQAEAFQKYKPLFFSGVILDGTLTDDDLPAIKQLATPVMQANAISLVLDFRNVPQIECIPQNIFALMWGERPITIRKFDAGSFLAVEKLRQRNEVQRNHLAPLTSSPPPSPSGDTGSVQTKPSGPKG
jgi:hypothetical protein